MIAVGWFAMAGLVALVANVLTVWLIVERVVSRALVAHRGSLAAAVGIVVGEELREHDAVTSIHR